MASFAERIGKRAPRTVIQIEGLDSETRIALWNALLQVRDVFRDLSNQTYGRDETEREVLTDLWTSYFRRARDEMGDVSSIWGLIKHNIQTAEWFDVLDLVEVLVKRLDSHDSGYLQGVPSAIRDIFNDLFAQYLVEYRFVGEEITPITSHLEVAAIEEALNKSQAFSGAQHHLEQAISLLSDRQNPDYANSIKESISAVESVARTFSSGKTLGDALNKLESVGLKIHQALKGAWHKLYGWASDEQGIRHGGVGAAEADQPLAKYMLISCSAFISYLIEEANNKELLQNETGPDDSGNRGDA